MLASTCSDYVARSKADPICAQATMDFMIVDGKPMDLDGEACLNCTRRGAGNVARKYTLR
jgi:hypothetical protein